MVSEFFPKKTSEKLQSLKEEENKEKFFEYLEVIFDMDSSLLEKIEKEYLVSFDNSDEKIKKLADLLKITPYDNFTTKIKYIEIAEDIIKKTTTKSEDIASLYNNLALLYYSMGEYEQAKPLYEKSLKIREEVLALNHPQTVSSYNNLALLYDSMGEYEQAKPLYEKALKINEKVLGLNHPDTATSYNNLASLYDSMGEYEQAKPLYEKALKINEKVLGLDHPSTATSYNKLASLYYSMGEYKQAKQLYEKALKISEESLGFNHPETTTSYNNLAELYRLMGEYEQAKPLYEKALKIREKVLGVNHPNTASSYNNLAELYHSMGEYEQAKQLYEKSLKIREKVLGLHHPDTASSYNNLALIYYSIKEYEQAKPLYEKSLKIREEVLGLHHPDTATSYNNLALLYNSMGEYEQAKPLYEKALKIREEVLGLHHPSTATSYNNLAGLYDSMKEYEQAKPLYEKSLKINEEVLGLHHPDTATSYNNLALLYNLMGEYEEALEIMIKIHGIQHPNTNTIYQNYKGFSQKAIFITSNLGISPYIKNVKIKNFKLLEDFEMDLNERINIIIGDNSSGKTSLLQAITLGLVEENYIGESNEKYHRYITKTQESSKIILGIDKYEKEVTITPKERKITNDILSPFVLAYGSNIFTRYKDEVNDLVQDILSEKINKGFTTSIFNDYTEGFSNPKSILNELSRINSKESKELEKIFTDMLNYFLDDFKLIKIDDKYLFKHNGKIDFKLENLSEGYRNNILLISDILIRILGIGKRPDTVEGIILIDEFDRHLHPKWQSSVVSKLREKFPKIQFILTTHNPMSILDREADQITTIKEIDGKLTAVKDKGTKNIDVGTVLLKYFGVKALVGETMQKNLKNFTRLKLKDDLTEDEEKKFEELKDTLDETVATNFIYNNGYFRFLKFAKTHQDIDFDNMDDLSDEELDELLSDFEESL